MKDYAGLQNQAVEDTNVFTNMFTLLFNANDSKVCTPSLVLPSLFDAFHNAGSESSIGDYESEASENLDDGGKRKPKAITACPHSDRKHYAKNMCNNCYHRLGRNKQAWSCAHADRQHYAKGKCQMCYLQHYHKVHTHGRKRGRRSQKKIANIKREVVIQF